MTTTPSTRGNPVDVAAARLVLMDALTLRPCHVTGMHTPEHHARFMCAHQKAAMLDAVLAALGIDNAADLPHALHDESCGWCHRVPAQERHREGLRETYRWAGVEIPAHLAEPGDDVPREGDNDIVWSVLTDEFQTWQDGLKAIHDATGQHLPHERWWHAVSALVDDGLVEVRDISARRRQAEPAPYEESEYGQGG